MFEKAYPNINVKLQNVGQGGAALPQGAHRPEVGQGPAGRRSTWSSSTSRASRITESLLDLTPYLPDDFLVGVPRVDPEADQPQRRHLRRAVGHRPARLHLPQGPARQGGHQGADRRPGTSSPTRREKYHKANPDSYLVNMPGGQTGQWLGLFWQNGARPFTSDPENLKINLTDPKNKEVTEYWDKLYDDGRRSRTTPTSWTPGTRASRRASTPAGSPPPGGRSSSRATRRTPRASGAPQALPQWKRGRHVSGNWGGSTLAVLKEPRSPAAAAEFARWILTEQEPVEMFSFERFLFPPQNFMLENPEWLNQKYAFYGGQQVNKVYAEIADTVDTDWEWDPDPRVRRHAGRRHQGEVGRRKGREPPRRCSRGRTRSSTTPSSRA